MSDLFDALQRSEGERSGPDSSTSPGATELLRRAERRAAANWESTAVLEEPGTAKALNGQTQPQPQGEHASQKLRQYTESAVSSAAAESPDVFSQFATLRASVAAQNRLVSLTDKESPGAEAFRLLAVRLRDLRRTRPLKKILVTSTIPQEGKSMISANLACTLAQGTSKKTLLLEGDLRRPSLVEKFGLESVPGLSEFLEGNRKLEASIYQLEGTGLCILPAGKPSNNPLEDLQSAVLPALMDQLSEWFDWIIIDSPPVLPLADASILTRLTDGILLVARHGVTERRQLQKGVEGLDLTKLVGAVLNFSKGSTYGDYYYYSKTKK